MEGSSSVMSVSVDLGTEMVESKSIFEGIAVDMEKKENSLSVPQGVPTIFISMASDPIVAQFHHKSAKIFEDGENLKACDPEVGIAKVAKLHSQSMPVLEALDKENTPKNPKINRGDEQRFESFRTFPGKLQRQISNLRGKTSEIEEIQAPETLPAARYFDALEGPELDTLRDSEETVLPKDTKWPFLLRFPISSFGICLGVSSQAIMWKTLASSDSTAYLHISPLVNLIIWLVAIVLVLIVSSTYILKMIMYFEAVRREYHHPVRVNFFFAPWIALLFLCLGLPPMISKTLPPFIWYILMTPIFCLELKIYGEWMSGGDRRLSKIANPSNHLAVVGNFVGALLGASMQLREGPIFFFAVGLAHYTVLFVTLYQRLPTTKTLPRELHPIFFLFIAAPCVASLAWARISGSFGYGSRIPYFIALFLYFSLVVRINFFRGFKFSLAWWAYTFPMTGAAIATVTYTNVAPSLQTKGLTLILCTVATLTVAALLVKTIIHAFILQDLFPNDMAIAISNKRPKTRLWSHKLSKNADSITQYLKFSDSTKMDDTIVISAGPDSV